jgi:hypothetical protein
LLRTAKPDPAASSKNSSLQFQLIGFFIRKTPFDVSRGVFFVYFLWASASLRFGGATLRGSLSLGPAASGGSARWRAHRFASLGRWFLHGSTGLGFLLFAKNLLFCCFFV